MNPKIREELYIDWEAADRITVAVLKDAYEVANSMIKEDYDGYMHPNDLAYNFELIKHLAFVLEYFGVRV